VSRRFARLKLVPADRIALVALGGIALSVGTWAGFAWIESVIQDGSFTHAALYPQSTEAMLRLSTIVVVLLCTLAIQMLYARRLRIEQRLRAEQARIQLMYEHSPDAIVCLDASRRVVYANPRAESLAGGTSLTQTSTTCHEGLWGRLHPCDRCPLEAVLATGELRHSTLHEDTPGRERWSDEVIYPVPGETGTPESCVVQLRDVTDLRMAERALHRSHEELEVRVVERTRELLGANRKLQDEVSRHQHTSEALRESEDRYRQLVERSPDMVLVHRGGRVAFVNSQGAALLGFESPDEAVGMSVNHLWEPNGSGVTREGLGEIVREGTMSTPLHVKLRRADDDLVDVELSLARLTYEGEPAVQCVVRDITERVRAQQTIERMAYYDPLTDLPNRTLFRDRLSAALDQAKRRGETVAVIFVDLDDFKAINDALGHVIGDGVLKAVGERLKALLRAEDTVARQSGDEFTIIARIADRDDVSLLAERVLASIREGFNVDGHELHVSASVGVATYPHDGDHDADLIQNADAAMYCAKEWGCNGYRLYSPDMNESVADRLELQGGLLQALERSEFELHYQPQVDMRDGSLVGVEALLRWNHPAHGELLPKSFLELAEQAGFMGEIGHWVLREACARAAGWHTRGLEFGRVAVNLSAREFVQQDIVTNVAVALEETGLPPRMLELEITETIALYNVEQILAILRLLRDTGVRVAIDDFGTGYSSMSYLKRFPVQTLKIAQAFMRDVHTDIQSAAIASMLIQLCRELDLDVVAEGVEHPSQLEFLRERGCFVIQGRIFSGPLRAEDLEAMLERGIELTL
jgi:diguanylate cyclase (GGDEF)-like protein/PAS domain S-box-containing protein